MEAHATTFSSDFTDLWWNASETGWGANVGNGFVFTGPLYQTSGPWFGGAFNASAVNARQVGTATFNGVALNSATLSYVVDGVSVAKGLTRQTWRADYAEEPATFTVTHSGTSFRITAQYLTDGSACTYTGNYSQAGRMGSSSGTISCRGITGTYNAFELEANISSMTGRAIANLAGCQWSGRFGGLYRGQ